jgi:post-segregation antitoxin (ccd killing protein)
MPKVSVYLPEALYREVRERHLPLSALTQAAVEQALRAAGRKDWVARVRSRPSRQHGRVDTARVMADVRDEFDA